MSQDQKKRASDWMRQDPRPVADFTRPSFSISGRLKARLITLSLRMTYHSYVCMHKVAESQ